MAGLVSATWKANRSIEMTAIDSEGRRRTITIPATIFAGIDFDTDPRLWAPLVQTAIEVYRPGLIGFVVVAPVKHRRIVDDGSDDNVPVVVDWSAGVGISGQYDGRV